MSTSDRPVRIGVFIPPYHSLNDDPTLAIRRDLELVVHLDRLGYDEAWIGEHHSAGSEVVSSPELFIAAAAEMTKRIRLGTGVISLPYHNPLTVANRMIQLDHQSMGRVMFGIGPGLLPSDAEMMGIPVSDQRDRMIEAIEVILRLLDGEVVSHDGSWFTLHNAMCQLRPFTYPRPEIAVASSMTPTGGTLAGRLGLSMLCMAATSTWGFDALDTNWRVACESAERHGNAMQRAGLRVVGPMHLAETREEAERDVQFGAADYLDYFDAVRPPAPGVAQPEQAASAADRLRTEHGGLVGTPDDAIEQLERLWKKTEGFGAYLLTAHNWADWTRTQKSYELFARYVRPWFTGANRARHYSLDTYRGHNQELIGRTRAAAAEATARYAAPAPAKPAQS